MSSTNSKYAKSALDRRIRDATRALYLDSVDPNHGEYYAPEILSLSAAGIPALDDGSELSTSSHGAPFVEARSSASSLKCAPAKKRKPSGATGTGTRKSLARGDGTPTRDTHSAVGISSSSSSSSASKTQRKSAAASVADLSGAVERDVVMTDVLRDAKRDATESKVSRDAVCQPGSSSSSSSSSAPHPFTLPPLTAPPTQLPATASSFPPTPPALSVLPQLQVPGAKSPLPPLRALSSPAPGRVSTPTFAEQQKQSLFSPAILSSAQRASNPNPNNYPSLTSATRSPLPIPDAPGGANRVAAGAQLLGNLVPPGVSVPLSPLIPNAGGHTTTPSAAPAWPIHVANGAPKSKVCGVCSCALPVNVFLSGRSRVKPCFSCAFSTTESVDETREKEKERKCKAGNAVVLLFALSCVPVHAAHIE